MGTSPYIRGNLTRLFDDRVRLRYIPVHTGQSFWLVLRRQLQGVHPRTYGAIGSGIAWLRSYGGTSPYIRGNLSPLWRNHGKTRYIPVHTGQSFLPVRFTVSKVVHPRTYGAIHDDQRSCWDDIGTSPYIRGNHQLKFALNQYYRYIPVHTGQSLKKY